METALRDFISTNRDELITRCRAKEAGRSAPALPTGVIDHGVPLFLDQLIEELGRESHADEIVAGASAHGGALRNQGFTIGQVVHGYGDVCQSITDLAVERGARISTADFRTLNRCLDDAIAGAVTQYAHGSLTTDPSTLPELRGLVRTAITGFQVLQTGTVGVAGRTGSLVYRSLHAVEAILECQQVDPADPVNR